MRTAESCAREHAPAKSVRRSAQRAATAQDGGRASVQVQRAATLNESARVRRQEARADAVQIRRRPDASGGVIQREPGDWALAGAGAALFGGAGWWLGGPLGAAVGAAAGAAGGLLLNRFRPRSLWAEVDHPRREYKSRRSPAQLADRLAAASPEYAALRQLADTEITRRFGRKLAFGSLSEAEARSGPAGYLDGEVSVDPTNHPAITVPNLAFETANAAQHRFFESVRRDYQDGTMMQKDLRHYADLLGVEPDELGGLAEEYAGGDLPSRRAILQEWGEWRSLELARPTLTAIEGRLTHREPKRYNSVYGFHDKLKSKTFAHYYYENVGQSHREDVENRLRGAKK